MRHEMTKDAILSVVRHVLTFGGGFLVAKGWADAAMIEAAVAAIVTLATVGWGIWDKKARA